MDLLERYLHAVRFWLPKNQRDDILAELSEDLRAEVEEREARLGRPLDESDISTILKRRGDPMLVASRYRPARYLVGPVLYPLYLFVLRLVLLYVILPSFALAAPILYATSGSVAGALQVVSRLPTALFSAFGAITLVFVLIERGRWAVAGSAVRSWDPRSLPPVPPTALKDRIPRSRSIGDMISGVFWAGVWVYGVGLNASINFAGTRWSWNHAWSEVYWPELVLLIATAIAGWVALLRPEWVRPFAIARVSIDCGALIATAFLLSAGATLTIDAPRLAAASLGQAQMATNISIRVMLVVIAILLLVDLIQQALRLPGGRTQSNLAIA